MKNQYIKILKMFLKHDNSYKSDIIDISFIQSNQEMGILIDAICEINDEFPNIELDLFNINDSREFDEFKLKNPGYINEYVVKIMRTV